MVIELVRLSTVCAFVSLLTLGFQCEKASLKLWRKLKLVESCTV